MKARKHDSEVLVRKLYFSIPELRNDLPAIETIII